MGGVVTVILGAGASYDCAGVQPVDDALRPPLTNDLFDQRFTSTLSRYDGAASIAGSLMLAVRRGEGFEATLKKYLSRPDSVRAIQVQEVAPYLQELLLEISERYVVKPINYDHLANELLASDLESIAFISLNYDLFMERILSSRTIAQRPPDSLEWYIEASRWTLIKIHGSANWGRRIQNHFFRDVTENGAASLNDAAERDRQYLDIVNRQNILGELSDKITFMAGTRERWASNVPFYPALVIPVEGKYELMCPPSHVQRLKQHLQRTNGVLCIGTSGRDTDLLDLLRDNLRNPTLVFHFVGNETDATEGQERFGKGVPQLRAAIDYQMFGGGFREYVEKGQVESFVELVTTFSR